jgi:peptidoglycan/LPS O-acetylase OafA/YrhL
MRLGYRPELDGVRAIAIALVVGLHSFGWPRKGALGVDLFFVLSGFLITTLLLEERAQTGRVSLPAFFRRRALRLLPALLTMLCVYATVESALGRRPWLGIVFGLAYVANIAEAAGSTALQPGLGHLWSLAQEEQFYLLWPALLLIAIRRGVMPLRLLGFLILVIVIERLVFFANGVALEPRIYRGPDTHADPLLVGCAAAFVFRLRRPAWVERSSAHLAIVALALVTAAAIAGAHLGIYFYVLPVLPAFAGICALLILSVAWTATGPVAWLLATKPFVFLGRISYSLYLWHVPIFVWMGGGFTSAHPALGHRNPLLAIVAIAAAIAAATASHYVIERPFLRLKSRSARPLPGPSWSFARARA